MHAYACTYTCSHMHMLILHGLLHSLHGLVPSSMDSTDSGPNVDPIDLWTSIKSRGTWFSPCYRNTSTLDLISTHASPLRTRPACLSPSHSGKSTRVHPPHREASLQIGCSVYLVCLPRCSTSGPLAKAQCRALLHPGGVGRPHVGKGVL